MSGELHDEYVVNLEAALVALAKNTAAFLLLIKQAEITFDYDLALQKVKSSLNAANIVIDNK